MKKTRKRLAKATPKKYHYREYKNFDIKNKLRDDFKIFKKQWTNGRTSSDELVFPKRSTLAKAMGYKFPRAETYNSIRKHLEYWSNTGIRARHNDQITRLPPPIDSFDFPIEGNKPIKIVINNQWLELHKSYFYKLKKQLPARATSVNLMLYYFNMTESQPERGIRRHGLHPKAFQPEPLHFNIERLCRRIGIASKSLDYMYGKLEIALVAINGKLEERQQSLIAAESLREGKVVELTRVTQAKPDTSETPVDEEKERQKAKFRKDVMKRDAEERKGAQWKAKEKASREKIMKANEARKMKQMGFC